MHDEILQVSALQRKSYLQQNSRLLAGLSHQQTPYALFITCADSRIMPEALFGLMPGDFFVLRNVGNVMPPYIQTEIGVASALEFAVLELEVSHIVVCGHTDCGAVNALDGQVDMAKTPALSRWLDLIRPAKRDVDFLMRDLSADERHHAIVNQNVLNQLDNIRSYPFIRKVMAANQIELHAWVYDLYTQQIRAYDATTEKWVV